jgi:hypothetical protein
LPSAGRWYSSRVAGGGTNPWQCVSPSNPCVGLLYRERERRQKGHHPESSLLQPSQPAPNDVSASCVTRVMSDSYHGSNSSPQSRMRDARPVIDPPGARWHRLASSHGDLVLPASCVFLSPKRNMNNYGQVNALRKRCLCSVPWCRIKYALCKWRAFFDQVCITCV